MTYSVFSQDAAEAAREGIRANDEPWPDADPDYAWPEISPVRVLHVDLLEVLEHHVARVKAARRAHPT